MSDIHRHVADKRAPQCKRRHSWMHALPGDTALLCARCDRELPFIEIAHRPVVLHSILTAVETHYPHPDRWKRALILALAELLAQATPAEAPQTRSKGPRTAQEPADYPKPCGGRVARQRRDLAVHRAKWIARSSAA